MLFNNNHGLPVSFTQADPAGWVQDPMSHAYPIQMDIQDATRMALHRIAAELVRLIQSNLNNSGPITIFAYNLFSINKWCNQTFMDVVKDTYDFTAKASNCNQTTSYDHILQQTVPHYCRYAVAKCIDRFPALQQVVPVDVRDAAIRTYHSALADIQQIEMRYRDTIRRRQGESGNLNLGQAINAPQASVIGLVSDSYLTEPVSGDNDAGGWGSVAARHKPTVQVAPQTAMPTFLEATRPVANVAVNQSGEVIHRQTNTRPRMLSRAEREQREQVQETVKPVDKMLGESLVAGMVDQVAVEPPPTLVRRIAPPRTLPERDPKTLVAVEEPKVDSHAAIASSFKEVLVSRKVIVPTSVSKIPSDEDDAVNLVLKENGEQSILEMEEVNGFGTLTDITGHVGVVVSPDNKEWTPSSIQKLRVMYDVNYWHRLFVQRVSIDNEPIGPQLEAFMKIEEGDPVNYLDLEIDPVARHAAIMERERDKTYIPLADTVAQIIPRGSVAYNISPGGLKNAVKAVIGAGDDDNLHGLTFAELKERCDPVTACVWLQTIIENERECDHVVAANMPSWEMVSAPVPEGKRMDEFKSVSNPVTNALNLIEWVRKGSPAMALQLDAAFTKDVNDVFGYEFGDMSSEIESFEEDFDELMDYVRGSYSAPLVEVFIKALNRKLKRWTLECTSTEIIVKGGRLSIYLDNLPEHAGIDMFATDLGRYDTNQEGQLSSYVKDASVKGNGRDLWLIDTTSAVWHIHRSAFEPSLWLLKRVQ